MTSKELNEIIVSHQDRKWLESLELTLEFNDQTKPAPLRGLLNIYRYASIQAKGWEKFGMLPEYLQIIKNSTESIKTQIEGLIDLSYSHYNYSYSRDRHWQNIQSQAKKIPFPYNSSSIIFLMELYKKSPSYFDGAYSFLAGEKLTVTSKDSMMGVLAAYEFQIEKNPLTSRSEAEQAKLESLNEDFSDYISQSEQDLKQHLDEVDKMCNAHTKEIAQLKADRQKSFDEWFSTKQSTWKEFDQNSKSKMDSWEETYHEKLRLSGPAEHWRNRAKKLKREARLSLIGLITIIILTCACLFSVLWLTPEGLLASFFAEDKSAAIRWSIVFITFVSFLAVGIRILTKVTFSAYHLSRDAEEREQLTFVYLAMVHEATVNKEDRHLIMQSLFSRADTGLLKDDSSPTMPGTGSIIDKVIQSK